MVVFQMKEMIDFIDHDGDRHIDREELFRILTTVWRNQSRRHADVMTLPSPPRVCELMTRLLLHLLAVLPVFSMLRKTC